MNTDLPKNLKTKLAQKEAKQHNATRPANSTLLQTEERDFVMPPYGPQYAYPQMPMAPYPMMYPAFPQMWGYPMYQQPMMPMPHQMPQSPDQP